MKRTIKTSIILFTTFIVLSALVIMSSCGGDEEHQPTVGEQVLINLVNSPWKVNSVTVDGVDKSALFTNFTLTFTSSGTADGKPTSFNGSYTTTNGDPVWPATGNWTITDQAAGSSVTRSDDVQIQLSNVTVSSFTMSLAWSKNTYGIGGRVESIQGQHVFVMGK